MNPKEAFQKLKGYVPLDWEETKLVESALNRLEKLEKVLKIIKEKEVHIGLVINCISYEIYKFMFIRNRKYLLTKTEFNLIKEVLK